jgi:hypothetical protein
MLGTFGGALEARQIDASNGRLTADVTGRWKRMKGVLVIRRIHVAMHLQAPEQVKEIVERVHGAYTRCAALFIAPCIRPSRLTSSYRLAPPGVDLDAGKVPRG